MWKQKFTMFSCFKKKKSKKNTLPELFKVNENYSKNEIDESDYGFHDMSSHVYEVVRFPGPPTSPEDSCSSLSKPPTPPSSGYWSENIDDDDGFETTESDGQFDSFQTNQINPNFSAIKNASYLSPLQKRESHGKCEVNDQIHDYKPKLPPRNNETMRSALSELSENSENHTRRMPIERVNSQLKTVISSNDVIGRQQAHRDYPQYKYETMQKITRASRSCGRSRNVAERNRYINMTPANKRRKTTEVHVPRSRTPMTSDLEEEMDTNDAYYETIGANVSSHTHGEIYNSELRLVSKNLWRAQRVEKIVANLDKSSAANIRNTRKDTRIDDVMQNDPLITSLPSRVRSDGRISEADNAFCRKFYNNFRMSERNITDPPVPRCQIKQFAENNRYFNPAVTDVRCTRFPVYKRSVLKPQTVIHLSAPHDKLYPAYGVRRYTANRLLSDMTSRNNDRMLLRV